jgi:drug/metabolite transporter (DMT)-like permease
VAWGAAFFFSKVAVAELKPFTIVLGRVGLAAITLNIIVLARRQALPKSIRTWGSYLFIGLLNNIIPFSLIFWGQIRIASGLAAILNAATPLWTAILAHFLTKDEKLTLNRMAGVLVGLSGVATMIGWGALKGLGWNVISELAVIGAGVSYAFAAIYGKRFKEAPPMVSATTQLTCSTLVILPIVLVFDQPWKLAPPNAATWGSLIGIALFSTSLAYLIYFRLLKTTAASNVLLATLLVPISALILGIFVLGETIEARQFAGMGLIGVGLAFIDGRLVNSVGSAIGLKHERQPSEQ